jgi:hypothetical protein
MRLHKPCDANLEESPGGFCPDLPLRAARSRNSKGQAVELLLEIRSGAIALCLVQGCGTPLAPRAPSDPGPPTAYIAMTDAIRDECRHNVTYA